MFVLVGRAKRRITKTCRDVRSEASSGTLLARHLGCPRCDWKTLRVEPWVQLAKARQLLGQLEKAPVLVSKRLWHGRLDHRRAI